MSQATLLEEKERAIPRARALRESTSPGSAFRAFLPKEVVCGCCPLLNPSQSSHIATHHCKECGMDICKNVFNAHKLVFTTATHQMMPLQSDSDFALDSFSLTPSPKTSNVLSELRNYFQTVMDAVRERQVRLTKEYKELQQTLSNQYDDELVRLHQKRVSLSTKMASQAINPLQMRENAQELAQIADEIGKLEVPPVICFIPDEFLLQRIKSTCLIHIAEKSAEKPEPATPPRSPTPSSCESPSPTLSSESLLTSPSRSPSPFLFRSMASLSRFPSNLFDESKEIIDPVYQHSLGMKYLKGDGVDMDLSKAIELLYGAANQGYVDAQYQLGRCYDEGQGVIADMKKAIDYYQMAVKQGHAGAQCRLGYYYQNGIGVEKDLKLAAELYQSSANQGYPLAQCNLGTCYEDGIGVGRDLKKARELYQAAASKDHPLALYNLGTCYEDGLGGERDLTKAVELYQLSANHGNARAQCNLGFCYQNGTGVEKDLKKAIEYYHMAVRQSHARGQNNLGVCYEYGIGVDKDIKKAVELYKLSADQGDAVGQCNLGLCYEHGRGVVKDVEKAKQYYELSAQQNYETAVEALKRIEKGCAIV